MASLHFSFQSIPLLHRPCAGLQKSPLSTFGKSSPATYLNFRFKNEGRLQLRPRLHPLFASNDNPSEGSDETKRADSAQGPPFLTILAGFFSLCIHMLDHRIHSDVDYQLNCLSTSFKMSLISLYL
ncbi:Hypothetical predicted protein [Olea europaea subsp. europaea]|uniref:Uncharacterized protein n=1 Tax=Olea europaea subsp. europaea TaxID=158383 RepID=A0A8S0QKB5_OLEEU|nr:Hypothetical predicted protein [Olea europaea subsp. europaea]